VERTVCGLGGSGYRLSAFTSIDNFSFKKLTTSYTRIKIPNTSPVPHKHTQQKVTTMGKKFELKYLHFKKQKLK